MYARTFRTGALLTMLWGVPLAGQQLKLPVALPELEARV